MQVVLLSPGGCSQDDVDFSNFHLHHDAPTVSTTADECALGVAMQIGRFSQDLPIRMKRNPIVEELICAVLGIRYSEVLDAQSSLVRAC